MMPSAKIQNGQYTQKKYFLTADFGRLDFLKIS
jgi:hypothetical protein